MARLLGRIERGINYVRVVKNFQSALAAALGGLSALDHPLYRAVRDWMVSKRNSGTSVYSAFPAKKGK